MKKDINENQIFDPFGLNFPKSPLSSLSQYAWIMKPHQGHVNPLISKKFWNTYFDVKHFEIIHLPTYHEIKRI